MKRLSKIILLILALISTVAMFVLYPNVENKIEKNENESRLNATIAYIDTRGYQYALAGYMTLCTPDSSNMIGSDNEYINSYFDYIQQNNLFILENDGLLVEVSKNNKKYSNNVKIDEVYYTVTYTFDENGQMTVTSNFPSTVSDVTQGMTNTKYLDDLGINETWYSFLSNYYGSQTADDVYFALSDFTFPRDMIKDAVITLTVPETLTLYTDVYYNSIDSLSFSYSIRYSIPYMFSILTVLGLMILLIPYRYITNPVLEKISDIKHIILLLLYILSSAVVVMIIYLLMSYEGIIYFKRILTELGIADYYTVIRNTILFIAVDLVFLLEEYAVYYFKYFLHKGIRRFFKENTFIYWLIHQGGLAFDELITVDLSKSSSRNFLRVGLINFICVSGICFIAYYTTYYRRKYVFIILMLIYTFILLHYINRSYKKIQNDYKILLDSASNLSQGHFNREIVEDVGMFNSLKDELNSIKEGFETAVEKEVESTNMKTELITNVSHDLKTPLTSLITYIDLLKDDSLDESTRKEYLDVLDHNALRLKNMVQDLFDVAKANSGNLDVKKEEVNLVGFIKQICFELEDTLLEKNLTIVYQLPDSYKVSVDTEKTYRVFENLLTNIYKYALENTRVYITLEEDNLTFKNISKAQLNFDTEHIKERFVQGDPSRNTQGSGLGLAIVDSFIEIQNYGFKIETDGDLFKAVITFKRDV